MAYTCKDARQSPSSSNWSSTTVAYATNYSINRQAGSYQYYMTLHDNDGYYPIRRWQSNPSQVAYIFEYNHNLADNNHWLSDYKYPTGGVWSSGNIGLPRYNPTAPHNNRTQSNMLCADGHAVTLGDAYNVSGSPTFTYKWY
jgi:prepilin-type processing-associated H-X9-DG protein